MMSRMIKSFVLAIATTLVLPGVLLADDETEKKAEPVPEPTRFVTEHRARFNDESIEYTAIAGETYVRDNDGKPKASIFTFAYTKKNVAENEVRPVTFIWNGGPGSASLWLHMGTLV